MKRDKEERGKQKVFLFQKKVMKVLTNNGFKCSCCRNKIKLSKSIEIIYEGCSTNKSKGYSQIEDD